MPSSLTVTVLLASLPLSLVSSSQCEGKYSCRIEHNLVDQFSGTKNLTSCLLHCLASEVCEVYSLDTGLEVCTLFSSCRTPDFSCPDCVTAEKFCPGESSQRDQ